MNDLYFAYGSNLNEHALKEWCGATRHYPLASVVGPAWLPDHEIAFTHRSLRRAAGTLNLRPRLGHLAAGVLFRVPDQAAWATLDAKEGAPRCYKRVEAEVVDATGRIIRATTYACPETDFVKPTDPYVAIVREGLQAHGLPVDALDAAARDEPASPPDSAALDGHFPHRLDAFFIYGTARRGQGLHRVVEPYVLELVPATIQGTLYDMGAYPGLRLPEPDEPERGDLEPGIPEPGIPEPGTPESAAPEPGVVHGEYTACDNVPAFIGAFDSVEGFHPRSILDDGDCTCNLYRRRLVFVRLEDDRSRPAWTYEIIDFRGRPRISGGDWLSR